MSGRTSRWVTIGKYPAISIREARAKYNEQYEAVHDYEKDIVADKKAKIKADKAKLTVSELINSYGTIARIKEKVSIDEELRAFNADVIPIIGDMYVEDVTSDDIDKIQHRILLRAKNIKQATSNGRVAVKNTLAYTRQLFNFAKSKKELRSSLQAKNWSNPVLEIESLGKKARRDRVLSFQELWLFWNCIEDVGLPPVTAKTLKFILATMQRGKEVRNMTWNSLKLNENVWEMQRCDTKNKKMHRVPLNKYSRSIVEDVSEFTKNSSYIFGVTCAINPPSELQNDLKPFSESALSRALKRKRTYLGIENLCPHDLRRTGATWITAVGLPKLYARLLLNHSDGENDVTGEVYIQYGYDIEKQKAVNVWAFVLDKIVNCERIEDIPTLEEVRQSVKESGLL
jgi:integrase